MTRNRVRKPPRRRKLLRDTLARLLGADRVDGGMGALAPAAPDPVMIATLAIDHVGPATVRAVAIGIEVQVAAPDEATAAVFRAALADTARRRSTDRLVRIIVD
jgi:hypothetical protein